MGLGLSLGLGVPLVAVLALLMAGEAPHAEGPFR